MMINIFLRDHWPVRQGCCFKTALDSTALLPPCVRKFFQMLQFLTNLGFSFNFFPFPRQSKVLSRAGNGQEILHHPFLRLSRNTQWQNTPAPLMQRATKTSLQIALPSPYSRIASEAETRALSKSLLPCRIYQARIFVMKN